MSRLPCWYEDDDEDAGDDDECEREEEEKVAPRVLGWEFDEQVEDPPKSSPKTNAPRLRQKPSSQKSKEPLPSKNWNETASFTVSRGLDDEALSTTSYKAMIPVATPHGTGPHMCYSLAGLSLSLTLSLSLYLSLSRII